MQERLRSSTQTVAVFDSCYSGALISQLSGENLTTIASTDYYQAAQDTPSFSSQFVPRLSSERHRGLEQIVASAADAQRAKYIDGYSAGSLAQIRKSDAFRDALRGEGVARNEPIADVLAREKQLRGDAKGIDTSGDGLVDSFAVDLNADGTPEAIIPDYNGDGELRKSDFTNRNSVDIEALTPAQRDQYKIFQEFSDIQKGFRASSRFALQDPVISGRLDGDPIDQVDSKGSGGATTTVGDDQTTKPEKGKVRGERGRSFDPNEKVGPAGFGEQGFLRNGMSLPYTIFFENDPEKATLPAQEVFITEVLDEDFDLTTFELGDMMVGDRLIEVPSDRTAWSTELPLDDPEFDLILSIEAELDFPTRTVTWTFATIDAETGLLTAEFDAGFLPVNDETGRGEGQVNYSIRPKADLATGTELTGIAEIVFDVNDPLITNSTLNTIDIDPPQATVDQLPETSLALFKVSWEGIDVDGSGIANYDVFVATDDGPFEQWLDGVSGTSRFFRGEVGSEYAFYATATDNVGLRELSSPAVEATTRVVASPWTNQTNRYDVNARDGVTAADALGVINELLRRSYSDPETSVLPSTTPDGFSGPFLDVNQDGQATALDALQVINFLIRRSQTGEPESPSTSIASMPVPTATSVDQPDSKDELALDVHGDLATNLLRTSSGDSSSPDSDQTVSTSHDDWDVGLLSVLANTGPSDAESDQSTAALLKDEHLLGEWPIDQNGR
ncbi:hypothetical protein Mal65_25270 [Crateriforma conspicua]|nr:hypothetical protein Mal65_25270 [Crateriforma conspicua]